MSSISYLNREDLIERIANHIKYRTHSDCVIVECKNGVRINGVLLNTNFDLYEYLEKLCSQSSSC